MSQGYEREHDLEAPLQIKHKTIFGMTKSGHIRRNAGLLSV